jgi:hypothetical protein
MPDRNPNVADVHCAEPGCGRTFRDHRWGAIRASADGWFSSEQEGKSWCPDHVPAWVSDWRARREQ